MDSVNCGSGFCYVVLSVISLPHKPDFRKMGSFLPISVNRAMGTHMHIENRDNLTWQKADTLSHIQGEN